MTNYCYALMLRINSYIYNILHSTVCVVAVGCVALGTADRRVVQEASVAGLGQTTPQGTRICRLLRP